MAANDTILKGAFRIADTLWWGYKVPLMRTFDIFFDSSLRNNMLNKQSSGLWFDTSWRSYLFHFAWWRHQMETFSASLAFVRGIHRSLVNSPHKGQWRGALMFSLVCAWISGWVNNREADDLRRHRSHYGVIVMGCSSTSIFASITMRSILYLGISLPSHRDLRQGCRICYMSQGQSFMREQGCLFIIAEGI